MYAPAFRCVTFLPPCVSEMFSGSETEATSFGVAAPAAAAPVASAATAAAASMETRFM